MKTFIAVWSDGSISVCVARNFVEALLEFDCESQLSDVAYWELPRSKSGYFSQSDSEHNDNLKTPRI